MGQSDLWERVLNPGSSEHGFRLAVLKGGDQR